MEQFIVGPASPACGGECRQAGQGESRCRLREIINDCAPVNVGWHAGGWASRPFGKPPAARGGVDLFEALMQRASTKQWRVFLLGAREEVVSGVKSLYRGEVPGLVVTGYRNGYWKADEEPAVVEQTGAQADLLFVATSSPKKEQFWPVPGGDEDPVCDGRRRHI